MMLNATDVPQVITIIMVGSIAYGTFKIFYNRHRQKKEEAIEREEYEKREEKRRQFENEHT